MNGRRILLDSNLIIYLAKGLIDIKDIIIEEYEYYISVISYMEILGYSFNDENEEDNTRELLGQFNVLYIDEELAEAVVLLRKKYKVKLPDAIICATAIKNNMIFYSNDKRLNKIDKMEMKVISLT